MQEDESIR